MQKEIKITDHYTPSIDRVVVASQDLNDMLLGPAVGDIDIEGLDLDAAAARLGISIDDLWRRIRNGQLLARTSRGKVYVYSDMRAYEADAQTNPPSLNLDLPPPPTRQGHPAEIVLSKLEEDHAQRGLSINHQEVALLIDHLSLAKEESREIIRLTQDSMARLTQMTDAILQMKDDVITAREQQVELLNERLKAQATELRAALRDKENFETLSRALSQQNTI